MTAAPRLELVIFELHPEECGAGTVRGVYNHDDNNNNNTHDNSNAMIYIYIYIYIYIHMYREREVYIHGYHHIIVSYNILYYIIGRTRTHMLNDYTKQAWSEPVKIVTVQRRFAWPLRKDDTHKSRSVNIKITTICTTTAQQF